MDNKLNINEAYRLLQVSNYLKSWDYDNYQIFANLCICTITTVNLWIYAQTNQYLNFSIPLICTHFAVDIFFCKPEFKLHHFFGLLVIAFKYYHNISPENGAIIILSLYKTELSTFLYVFRQVLNEPSNTTSKTKLTSPIKYLNHLNTALFFITFFKFRLLDFYNNVIVNPAVYEQMYIYTKNNTSQTVFIYSGLYGLFILNTYWFVVMCKIIYKPVHQMLSDKICIPLCHTIVSYTHAINIPISGLLYSTSPNSAYLFDMIGLLFLTYGSYIYHQKMTEYYNTHGQIEYTSYELMHPFVLDQVAIHTRMFLCTVTNLYYTGPTIMQSSLLFSFANHSAGIYYLINYLYNVKHKDQQIFYNSKHKDTANFLSTVNALVFIPVIIDGIIIFLNTGHLIHKLHAVFITILSVIILKIAPFYELNHVAFHLIIIAQNVYLTLCNISEAN